VSFANEVVMPIGAPTVTIAVAAGVAPVLANPNAVPAVVASPVNPKSGDVFINRTDGKMWVYAPDPGNPGAFVWETVAQTKARGSVFYVGTEPFDPGNVAAPWWGMSADTRPDPSVIEPFGGDVYFSTQAGDITLLAGQPPTPPPMVAGREQHLYVGPGPFDPGNVVAPVWGMAIGTRPDPATLEPQPGDVYFDTVGGDIYVLG
jgi:hypothetical protein